MAFRNPPIAGLYLVRPALRSPNYVQGSTGWTIDRDGSSEFNAGVFRGSVRVTDASTHDSVVMVGSKLQWGNLVTPPYIGSELFGVADSNGAAVTINSGLATNTDTFAELQVNSAQGFLGQGANILASTRNQSFTGSVAQCDRVNVNNYFHADVYSGTVSGGDGHWIFAHGCAFPPTVAILTPYGAGGGDGPGYVRLWTTATDANNCYTIWRDDGGGITANGTVVGVHAVFFG